MKAYPFVITRKMKTYHGNLIIGEKALYFISSGKVNVLKAGILKSENLEFKSIIKGEKDDDYDGPQVMEELDKVIAESEDNMKFEAHKIDKIQQNWLMKKIGYEGKTYGLPNGISKELKEELKPWAQKNSVKTVGF